MVGPKTGRPARAAGPAARGPLASERRSRTNSFSSGSFNNDLASSLQNDHMVAVRSVSRLYAKVNELDDLPPMLMDEGIEQIFINDNKIHHQPTARAAKRGNEVREAHCKSSLQGKPHQRYAFTFKEPHSTASRIVLPQRHEHPAGRTLATAAPPEHRR